MNLEVHKFKLLSDFMILTSASKMSERFRESYIKHKINASAWFLIDFVKVFVVFIKSHQIQIEML